MTEDAQDGALARAQQTIARLADELTQVRGLLADAEFADELRHVLTVGAVAGTIASPVSHVRLLEMIVATAAQVISAGAGSLFLIDREAEELVFEVALGQKAEEVRKFRVPLGHGIAGMVAITGQPMMVSDAQHDERQAADIAQSVGYVPQSILCVPLYYGDEVVGVLELLDKVGASSFSPADVEVLTLFANQAAIAIEQSRLQGNQVALLVEALASVGGMTDEQRQALRQRVTAFTGTMEAENADYQRALQLARLVHEIAQRGEPAYRGCEAILGGFAQYLRSQRDLTAGLGMGTL